MDINNTGKPVDLHHARSDRLRSDTNAAGRAGAEQKPARGVGAGPAAEVQLSSQALQLRDTAASRTADSFSAERISSIRASIAAGEYHVDSAKLADNILRLEQDIGLE